jgi:membrane-associated phospholipid phosphatase
MIRNQFGSALVNGVDVPLHSFTNAVRVIRIERALGLYHEESIQDFFLPYTWLIETMNTYYGTAHFFVTLGVFILLFKRRPDVFGQWRNTLAAMTGLAIIGFVLFPLMPPRLLDAPCPSATGGFGGACIEHELRNYNGATNFGYVDTIAEFGGPWAFNEGPAASLSNQYAAMPSLHIGWSTWCVFALWPLAKKRWKRIALFLYPATTLFCIVVTGNHFWLDGLGGLVVFVVGYYIGTYLHNANHRRLDARMASHPAQ